MDFTTIDGTSNVVIAKRAPLEKECGDLERTINVEQLVSGFILAVDGKRRVCKTFTEVVRELAFCFGIIGVGEKVSVEVIK